MTKTIPTLDRPDDVLAGLLYDVCTHVRSTPTGKCQHAFCHVSFDILSALSRLRGSDSLVEKQCEAMQAVFQAALIGPLTPDQIAEFNDHYAAAQKRALPTVTEFLKHCHDMSGYTDNHSLNSISLGKLLSLETEGHFDSGLSAALRDVRQRLQQVTSMLDVKGYSQAFELYAEAVVYAFLKARFHSTVKIDERGGNIGPTPDFKCEWNGKVFYVEVKSFDVVDGEYRHQEMMNDALETNVELEQQILAKRQVAMAEREIAPYRKLGADAAYDSRSLIRVIETLTNRAWRAFKPSQFTMGQTFALAVLDRLVLPGNRYSLAPYYYDNYQGGAIVSGVLWQTCFGQTGGPIFRLPDFEGGPSLEGYLTTPGLYTDPTRDFPGVGFVTMQLSNDPKDVYGLFDHECVLPDGWTSDDLEGILDLLCSSYYNDKANSKAYLLSHYTP